MNKIKNLVRMDFATVKPYLTIKNLIIYLGVILLLIYSNRSMIAGISSLMMFVSMFATYPFAVGDQNGMDTLYTVLGVRRKDVVSGRYYFMLIMNMIGIILCSVIALLLSVTGSLSIDYVEIGVTIAVVTLLSTLIQLIQYPIFFKVGYMKAKFYSYLPYVLIVIGFFAVASFLERINDSGPFAFLFNILTFLGKNPYILVGCVVVIWILLYVVSKQISLKYYSRREF